MVGTSPQVPKPTGVPVFYWQNATKIKFSTIFLGMILMMLRFQDRGNSGRVGREGGADVITGDLWSKWPPLAPYGYAWPVSNDLCSFRLS